MEVKYIANIWMSTIVFGNVILYITYKVSALDSIVLSIFFFKSIGVMQIFLGSVMSKGSGNTWCTDYFFCSYLVRKQSNSQFSG